MCKSAVDMVVVVVAQTTILYPLPFLSTVQHVEDSAGTITPPVLDTGNESSRFSPHRPQMTETLR